MNWLNLTVCIFITLAAIPFLLDWALGGVLPNKFGWVSAILVYGTGLAVALDRMYVALIGAALWLIIESVRVASYFLVAGNRPERSNR